jgi:hypothetical protein
VQAVGGEEGFAPRLDGDTPADATANRQSCLSWQVRCNRDETTRPPAWSDRRGMTTLDNWTAAACGELGIDVALVDIRQILDVARVAAHQVERPAAPLTAYLLGLAVGNGQPADEATAQLAALAAAWPPP